MNLNETMQHIFDTVVPLVIQQGKGSFIYRSPLESSCAYRGDGGLKCAIGFLIEDSRYEQSFEGTPAKMVMDCLDWVPNSNLDLRQFRNSSRFEGFLHTLQTCHDNASRSADFVKEFKRLCVDFLSDFVDTSKIED